MFKARINITLKKDVLDPQGKAVKNSLISLGYDEVNDLRVGKYIEVMLNTENRELATERVEEMCKNLLANTVIEDYQFEIDEVQS